MKLPFDFEFQENFTGRLYFHKIEISQMSNEEENPKNFTVIQSTEDWNNFLQRVSNFIFIFVFVCPRLVRANFIMHCNLHSKKKTQLFRFNIATFCDNL